MPREFRVQRRRKIWFRLQGTHQPTRRLPRRDFRKIRYSPIIGTLAPRGGSNDGVQLSENGRPVLSTAHDANATANAVTDPLLHDVETTAADIGPSHIGQTDSQPAVNSAVNAELQCEITDRTTGVPINRVKNPYHPFHSEVEFGLAHYFLKQKLSNRAINYFLKSPWLRNITNQLSYRSADELFDQILQSKKITPEYL